MTNNYIIEIDSDITTPIEIFEKDTYGSYFVTISSTKIGGATAAFSVSRSSSDVDGMCTRMSQSRGKDGRTINVCWKIDQGLCMCHTNTKTVGNKEIYCYRVNVI